MEDAKVWLCDDNGSNDSICHLSPMVVTNIGL